jgi:arsenate reductase (thioredoxin)
MTKVLFLCVHNSSRSQMAEAFLKKYAPGRFEVESAGLEAGRLNPYVVRAMAEVGIDISQNKTKSVVDLFNARRVFQVVVTVCSKEAADKCPIFPGQSEKLHWPFPDPASFTGTDEEIMAKVREVRGMIEEAVKGFIATHAEEGNRENVFGV